MPISRDKKKEIFEKVKDAAQAAKSIVFVNFKGLTVGDATAVRKDLREKNIKYYVAKKTIASKAFAESKFEGEEPNMPGEIAFVWGDDLIAPAREIAEFVKKLPEKINIIGGVFDGKFMNETEMKAIAAIPSRETLYAQFVNLINSPISGFVRGLDAIAKSKN